MPPHPPRLTRRTTVGAALVGLVTVTGCDLDDLDPRSDSPQAPSADSSAPPEDADTVLVADVVASLGAATLAAASVRRRDRAAVRPLLQLHRRHLDELGGPRPTSAGARVPVPELVRREQALQVSLATAAVAAESGELARVLASMSAAVAQQLAVLAPAAAR